MIDMHSHILPNIDDGARSIDDTYQLIKEAKEAGFEGIITTPHYIEGYYETDIDGRETLINAISQNIENKKIDVKLYLGNEIYLTENFIKLLEDAKASTINNTSYVLFEMPLNSEPIYMYEIIREMKKNKLVPILAHPERYSYIQQEPNIVYDLIEQGVLMQSNYASIIGYYGVKAQIIVEKLLKNNMVHFLGSDVHRPNTIYPKIPQILNKIKNIVGEEKLNELTTINPELVLNNKRIDIEKPQEIELTFKEKLKMRFMK